MQIEITNSDLLCAISMLKSIIDENIKKNVYTKCYDYLKTILYNNSYTNEQILNYIDNIVIDASTINNVLKMILTNNKIKILLFGYIDEIRANEIYKIVSDYLTTFMICNTGKNYKNDGNRIKNDLTNQVCRSFKNINMNDNNSAICKFFLFGSSNDKIDVKKQALLLIINHIASKSFFNKLRFVEQLGYIVNSDLFINESTNNKCFGLSFIVQTSGFNLEYVDKRICAFIKTFRKQLYGLTLNDFLDIKNKIIENLVEKSVDYLEEYLSMRNAVLFYDANFDIKNKYCLYIKELKFCVFLQNFDELFIGRKKRVYTIKVNANKQHET